MREEKEPTPSAPDVVDAVPGLFRIVSEVWEEGPLPTVGSESMPPGPETTSVVPEVVA